MGNYLQLSTLVERMGQTVVENLCRNIDAAPEQDAFLNRVIDRAEGMINSYAGRAYEIPMPASDVLEELTLRFVEFELYKRAAGDDIPTKYKLTEDDRQMLLDMGEGIIVPPGSTPRTTAGTSIDTESDTALMSDDAFSESPSTIDGYYFWWP